MAKDCPASTQERHEDDIKELYCRSLPGWVRDIVVAGIIALFALYGAQWAYNATVFVEKEEVKEMRAEIRGELREIKDQLARIASKP